MNTITRWLLVVIVLASLAGTAPVWAKNKHSTGPARFLQGVVTDYRADRLVVNETWKIHLTGKTQVLNVEGEEMERFYLEGHRWVYVEGIERKDGSIEAVKVYLLPKYIDKKERVKYPFIKLP